MVYSLVIICYLFPTVAEFEVDCTPTYDGVAGVLTITCITTTPGQEITEILYSVDESTDVLSGSPKSPGYNWLHLYLICNFVLQEHLL